MCDIQGCLNPSLFDLADEDSEDISRKKGYLVKKLCKAHNYFLCKSKGGNKKREDYCCDPRQIHGSKAKSNYTVKEDFCQEIEALQCRELKEIRVGDFLCRHCQEFIKNLTLENKINEDEEEGSSMEIISQASNSGLTQEDNLKKLNDCLDSFSIKTVKKNPSVASIEEAMDELKKKVFNSLGLTLPKNDLHSNINLLIDN